MAVIPLILQQRLVFGNDAQYRALKALEEAEESAATNCDDCEGEGQVPCEACHGTGKKAAVEM